VNFIGNKKRHKTRAASRNDNESILSPPLSAAATQPAVSRTLGRDNTRVFVRCRVHSWRLCRPVVVFPGIPFPPSAVPVPRLWLPPLGYDRQGSVNPIVISNSAQHPEPTLHPPSENEPRHRLGVSALALDTTTQLIGRPSPEGILYTGARDSLSTSPIGIHHSWQDLYAPNILSSDSKLISSWTVWTYVLSYWCVAPPSSLPVYASHTYAHYLSYPPPLVHTIWI
jgi:hypothetical protein